MTSSLPTCCPDLKPDWPLPYALEGVVLTSAHFDPGQLLPEDWQRCQIDPPASIQRSVAKRQTEFLAGRLCAREALRRLDGRACVPAIGEDRAPVWPAGICGSITHSTGWAAAIVAQQAHWRGLGLDAEHLLDAERARRLAGEILTAEELARLHNLPAEQIALCVTLTFSIKEALFKALYPLVGKRFYFEDAHVLEWSADGQVRLGLLCDLSEEWHHGKQLQGQFGLHNDHLLSLVAIAR
ncbi:4'-phosphopantetheinyl transferase family protein [Pseudomonas ovata]|uniref:4'-phosphopantetheinyl transferase family protein n=1 Tax=Pseudomonas ovata TaxID=1839709 RepID=UPI000D69A5F1|nr:4'-phosphopantetheinyl transferase superfamily protein [Pseudomonas ovata]